MHTYVLVHGGGHGGWCYDKVTRRLQALGHRVYAPSLPGLGEHAHVVSPAIDLDAHIDDVVNLLFYEDLHDVIIVGHSYGGMVITGVADRAADRVGKVVYLDAANPVNGQSLVDVAGPHMLMAREMGEVRDGIELVLLPGDGAAGFLRRRGSRRHRLGRCPPDPASVGVLRAETPAGQRSGDGHHPEVPHRVRVDDPHS